MRDLDKILDKIESEHPYKVPGDSSSYNQYNEGWCDCLDRVRLELKDVNDGWISVEEGLPEKPIDLSCEFKNENVELQELYGIGKVAEGNVCSHPYWGVEVVFEEEEE